MKKIKKEAGFNVRIRVSKEFSKILKIIINENPNIFEISPQGEHRYRMSNVDIYQERTHKDGSISLYGRCENGYCPLNHHPLNPKARCNKSDTKGLYISNT